MHLPRFAFLLPLLAACASDPVHSTPATDRPTPAQTASTSPDQPRPSTQPEPAAEPERRLDRSFLIGVWGPNPDVPEIDAKIDALIAGDTPEQAAVMVNYLARFFFHADGTCEYGISSRGEFNGDNFEWTAEQLDAQTLQVRLFRDGTTVGPPLKITRENDLFRLTGDPTLTGAWIPLMHGEHAEEEDEVYGRLGVEHLKYREKLAVAAAQIEDSLTKRKEGFETLVKLVKTVCEGEELIGKTSRTSPIRGDNFTQLRDSQTSTERLLMDMPVPSAPKSPVLPEHVGQSQAFDEAWLADSWGFQTEVMDWDKLLPQASAEMLPEIKKVLESRRRVFEIRGTYLNTLGAPEILESMSGYYCVTPGAGEWVWVTILEQHGSADVGIVDDRIQTLAAYRVGDVLWIEEGQGMIIPHVRKAR